MLMHGGQTARGVIRRVVPSPALQWDPLAPETEIQSTLRNRFTGRKDLQRRLKELEAKRKEEQEQASGTCGRCDVHILGGLCGDTCV